MNRLLQASRIVLAVTLLFFSACDKKDDSYFPLTEGIEWRYRVSLKSSGATEQHRYYTRSQGENAFDDNKYQVHRSLTGMETLYRLSSSGVERVGYNLANQPTTSIVRDELLLIPYPIVNGFEWESTIQTRLLIRKGAPGESSILANVPAENTIEILGDVIEVPAGKFRDCMKVTTNGFAFHSGTQHKSRTLVEIKESRWYAKGVGLVKASRLETSTSDAFGTREEILELESVKIP